MAVDNLIISIIILFSIHFSRSARYEYVTVDTSAGPIRGIIDFKTNYTTFLGIPYARVNYSNPFGDSIPITESFTETFNAIRDGNRCAQYSYTDDCIYYCSLDCLHLSIYVPNTEFSEIPVLIFINNNDKDGTCWRKLLEKQFLIKQDIIIVTMSIRQSLYGFLCLDTPEVPGNQQLKDQLTAMRWVKRHIASFGGDTDKITLFGHNSGAHQAHFHLLYSKEPLFNQIILQSGNSYSPLITTTGNRTIPIKVANYLGFETTDFVEATKYLAESEPCVVVKATVDLNIHLSNCVEKEFENVERIVTDYPLNVAEVPNANDINVILGHTEDEMAIRYNDASDQKFFRDMREADYLKLVFDLNDEQLTTLAKIVGQFYFRDTIHDERNIEDIYDMGSDIFYVHPTQRVMKNMFRNGANKVFFSVFSYKGPLSHKLKAMYKQTNGYTRTMRRAAHAEERFGVYKNFTENDQRMIDIMTNLYGNFVKYGDPTPQTSELLPVKWTPITKDSQFIYLNLTTNLTLHDEGLWPERIAFWDLIYDVFKKKQRHYEQH